MKTTLKIFLFLVVAFGFSATAMAQNGTASVTIMSTISIAKKTNDLTFGNIIPSASAGVVTVNTAGSRTTLTNVTSPNENNISAADFEVSGTAGATFQIGVPANGVVTLTRVGGGGTAMNVKDFTFSPANSPSPTLDGTGKATVLVGATLEVGANQLAGSYTGTFTVTAAYN